MAGFEPTTTCTPSRCATRLRYIPNDSDDEPQLRPVSIIALEESQYFAQLLAHLAHGGDASRALFDGHGIAVGRRDPGRQGRVHPSRHLDLQALLGAGDREALLVEELLDAQDGLDVAPAVDALAGAVLGRGERRELGLPVAQHVRLRIGDLADLTDLEEELVRDRPVHRGLACSPIPRGRRTASMDGTRRICAV